MRGRLTGEAPPVVSWPEGKSFAFTIFDDTDLATLDAVVPVYRFLEDLGFRTTKSVWPLDGREAVRYGGATCEDPAYRAWTVDLQARGFEIGYHGASYATSPRERVNEALERFREVYGHYPRTMSNHTGAAESIYWGSARVSGANRFIYKGLTALRRHNDFRGHVAGDRLFWGDLCRERVTYVRNFTYADVDTLAACPVMPYVDTDRPYVNAWFASSEGAHVRAFNARLSEANQDRLEEQGGACIMYTHLACGFAPDGRPDPRFRRLMERLAQKGGWFVPVATLLDHLVEQRGTIAITPRQRSSLERRWLRNKLRVGPS